MDVEAKELAGVHLLNAMKHIDIVVQGIGRKGTYHQEMIKLLECKRELKKVLNKHFDELAIKRCL